MHFITLFERLVGMPVPKYLLIFFALCANTDVAGATWQKDGGSKEQLSLDTKECSAFIERLVRPVPSEGKIGNKIADLRGNRYSNSKNRRAIRRWCMENRGYSRD